MSTTPRSELRHFVRTDHDEGLDHPHEWARERGGAHRHGPMVADAMAVPAPSSTRHDDALYG